MSNYIETRIHPSSSRSRGGRGGHAPPPSPVKISHKKDGHRRRLLRFHVSRPPLPDHWIRYCPSPLLLVLQPHLYIENHPPNVKFPNSNCNRNSYPVNIHSTTENVGSWCYVGHMPLEFQCSLINIDAMTHHRPH